MFFMQLNNYHLWIVFIMEEVCMMKKRTNLPSASMVSVAVSSTVLRSVIYPNIPTAACSNASSMLSPPFTRSFRKNDISLYFLHL